MEETTTPNPPSLPPLPPPVGAGRSSAPMGFSTPGPAASSMPLMAPAPTHTAPRSSAPPPVPTGQRSPLASANPVGQLGPAAAARSATSGSSGGAKMALGAFVVFLVIGVLYAGFRIAGEISATTTVNNLETGDCVANFFQSDANGYSEVYLVKTADCATPHAMEVYAAADSLFAGAIYPGVDAAFEVGDSYCYDQFAQFTGESYEESPYEMWVFVPIQSSWDQGDRRVQCLIGSYDEVTLVEGSLRGAAL